ncbi:M48 family metallopeptidase [bacterium]|nr:M48 family metallopeptidase [bacterium]
MSRISHKGHPLLDPERQRKARKYEKEKRLLGLVQSLLSLFILLGFYFSGWSYVLAHSSWLPSFILTFLFYVIFFQALLVLLGLPLHFYNSYVHEHKWGFSNHTLLSWMWDQAKSFLVSMVILGILLSLLLWILEEFPSQWWLIAGMAMALVSVIFSTLFPVVVLPVFNKYTPIQDKELTSALDKILAKEGLKSSGFFKEDTSRQTKKENAFLAGLGKTRRVVLSDNLMENMSIPQIVSIIAHEVGHHKYKHMWKHIALGTLQQLGVFYVLNLILQRIFPQFLSSPQWNLTLFPIFLIIMGAISGFILGPLSQALSRFFEKQADHYALENIENKRAFMTALAGLADRNLSNAYPPWWVKWLYYSHPPVGERLQMSEEYLSHKEKSYPHPSQQ